MLNFAQSFSERSLTVTVRAVDADFARERLVAAFSAEHDASSLRDISYATPIGLVAIISSAGNGRRAPGSSVTSA